MKKIILVFMLAFGVGMAESESYWDYVKGNEAFLAKDYKQAEIYFKQVCEQDQLGYNCRNIGDAFLRNEDYTKADFFYQKACEKYIAEHSYQRCAAIGNNYLSMENYEKAKFYYKKVCEKDKSYCDYDARIDFAKGDKYLYGKNYKQAEIYYKQACQKSKNYCNGEAKIADAKGEGYRDYFKKGNEAFLDGDYKQAEIHYKKACEKQAPNDDYLAFADFRQNCNAHSAMEYFDKVCKEDIIDNYCMQLGDMYYEGNKEMGVEKNIPLAKEYWTEILSKISVGVSSYWSDNIPSGWDNGFYDTILSYLEGREKTEYQKEIKPNYTKARLLAEIACEKGGTFDDNKPIGQACEILGDIYAQGKGVKQDLNKAKALYQKACENPHLTNFGDTRGYQCGISYTAGGGKIAKFFGCAKLGDIYYLGQNLTETKKWWMEAIDKLCENDEWDECSKNKWHNRWTSNILLSGYFQEAEGYYNGFVIKKEGWDYKEDKYIEKDTYIKHEQDYTKAVLLANLGCDEFKDFKSCSILVNAYTQGKGILQSLNIAQAYLTKAKKYEAEYLYKEAKKLGQNICSGENGEYINDSFDEPNQAQAVAKQRAQIKELLQKACNLDKSNQACTDLKNKSYKKWNLDNVY